MTTKHENLAGWADFLTEARRPDATGEGQADTGGAYRKRWTWTGSLKEAMSLAEAGWSDGFKELSLRADGIVHRLAGNGDLLSIQAEAGDEVDIGLFMSEDPECMIEYQLSARRKPVVKFVVSASFASGVSPETIYNRGAAVVAAIDQIEASGMRCEVELSFDTRNDGRIYRTRVPLKRADDAVDRDKLAFAICHPSTLRRLYFRLAERFGKDDWEKRGGGSYGTPVDPEAEDDAIVIPSLRYGSEFGSMDAAVTYAESLIAQAVSAAN